MESNYLCPHCRGYLNIGDMMIFKVKQPSGKIGLIILHTDIENYNVQYNGAYKPTEGQKSEFYCPLCGKSLEDKAHKDLARIVMRSADGKDSAIIFSKIYGEHATYQVVGEDILSFGEQAKRYYLDPDWFKS